MTPPEGCAAGERLSFEGVVGGPFEPVSAAQMEKKKVLDKILPVRHPLASRCIVQQWAPFFAVCSLAERLTG